MTAAANSQLTWEIPRIVDNGGTGEIEFRDCIVQLAGGVVTEYHDKERQITLKPSTESIDEWLVHNSNGELTGQRWYGVIAFDGRELLIQQEKHSRMRVYRLDGEIETQFRGSRMIELAGCRSTLYHNGLVATEDLLLNNMHVTFDDVTIIRDSDGTGYVMLPDGRFIKEIEWLPDPAAVEKGTSPTVEAYRPQLKHWSALNTGDPSFALVAPPGLNDAEPGMHFRRAVPGKLDDFRESKRSDFNDGTFLFEYCGRLNGAPFVAHEVTSMDGLILARHIVYDQAQRLAYRDDQGRSGELADIVGLEVVFDPERLLYATTVTFADGNQWQFPAQKAAAAPSSYA